MNMLPLVKTSGRTVNYATKHQSTQYECHYHRIADLASDTTENNKPKLPYNNKDDIDKVMMMQRDQG